MELPHLGEQCKHPECKKLNFLPITCDACSSTFCEEHYTYTKHDCPNAYLKNNQVPVCPLCDVPIPVARGVQPDVAVGAHIDNDCQSDPARTRRKVFTNRCSKKGCKVKEVVPIVCNECKRNYCLKHRHFSDHDCKGMKDAARSLAGNAAQQRQSKQQNQNQRTNISAVQGNISEDEALARALALSMQETTSHKELTQEELDLALARQLQMETVSVGGPNRNSSNRCNVQ